MRKRYNGFRFNLKIFLRESCSRGQSFISVPQMVLKFLKKLFCFSKITDTRNSAVLKPVKFWNLGDFTQLAIKQFPQSILQWSFDAIFPIDLGFQPQQIQLYINLFQVLQNFGSNPLGYYVSRELEKTSGLIEIYMRRKIKDFLDNRPK